MDGARDIPGFYYGEHPPIHPSAPSVRSPQPDVQRHGEKKVFPHPTELGCSRRQTHGRECRPRAARGQGLSHPRILASSHPRRPPHPADPLLQKRKLSKKRMDELLASTVHRAPIFSDPLTRVALMRECGSFRPARDISYARGKALGSLLQKDYTVQLGSCGDCGRVNTCFDFAPLYDAKTVATTAGDTVSIVTLWDVTTRPEKRIRP